MINIKQSRQKDQPQEGEIIPFSPITEIYSREAEQSVLGGLMQGEAGFNAWAQVKKILVADDFFLKEHQIFWTTIESVIAGGARPDIITLGDQLQKDDTLAVVGGWRIFRAISEEHTKYS